MRDLADELLQAKARARQLGGDHAPRLGRLVILDRIGAGAMGTVYAAYDPRLDRKVAVKVMHAADPDANARFVREARALGKLAHPNIVAIYDAGDDTGTVHVVMELATGVPLRAWIENPDRSWRDVVRVMSDVASALAAAHRANIVHRDVKPDNILVGDDRARLVDFGLAREPAECVPVDPSADLGSPSELAVTAVDLDDHTAGTPSYMAPEVLAGATATPASDQFSFAVTLFEALHGRRPHHGATRAELRDAALRAADAVRRTRSSRPAARVVPPPADPADPNHTVLSQAPVERPQREPGLEDEPVARVPAWIDAILKRALAPDPEKRFPSMDALGAELQRDRRRRQRAIAILAAAVAAGGVIGVLAYRARETAGPPAEDVSCDGSAKLATVWNDRAAHLVRTKLQDVPWADATLAGLQRAAAEWETSFRTVCEATRVRGEQSDRLLELRVRCLDRTLDRFGALADALSAPLVSRERVEAPSAVSALPVAKTCETVTEEDISTPEDPAARAETISIQRELDHAWAAHSVGRYRNARTRTITLYQRVAKLPGADALQAAVLLLGGALEARIGDRANARNLLERAIALAAKARAPRIELAAWARLLRQAVLSGDADKAIDWTAFAEAAVLRAGDDGTEIEALVGEALRQTGKLDQAHQRLSKALASPVGLREDSRAMIEMNLGSVDLALGRSALAEPAYRRAYDRAKRALGEGHPTLAIMLDRLAESARARGHLRSALELHDRSIALRRSALGDKDRAVATAYLHRAETLLEAGRLDEARVDAVRALDVRSWSIGRSTSRLAEIHALLGEIEVARGKLAEATKHYDDALELDAEPTRRIRGLVMTLGTAASPKAGPLERTRFRKLVEMIGISEINTRRIARDGARLEPFGVEHVATTVGWLSLLPPDLAAPLVPPLLARWRAAGPVDAALSLAVADALLASGDRTAAAEVYRAALAALADEPSRARLHAFRGLALAADDAAAATSAAKLAAAMPQLAR